ncbi:MAG: hypothetical protein MUC62_09895 [Candidatus Thermoplasmatota archaeon]|nr:hypothetical protein [Candidatus Thermoplasmatota archaeon]
MDVRRREVILVLLTSILVISALGALVMLDRSHGSFGKEINPAQVDASITNVQGSIAVEQVPSDLYMFGAGLSASLSVQITNMDPDNDIDSVRFTIPDSQVQTSSFEWYRSGEDHEWNMASDQPGVAIFTAQNDLPGHIFGGSAQYDVAGNIDDALDHDPLNNTNEEATFTLGFTAPAQPGFKTGANSINVEVADMLTETPGAAWQTVDPFPMPYLVVENGNRFVVMVLKTSTCDMSIVHDGTPYFVPTRSDITTSSVGFKLTDDQGKTFIVVSDPGTGKVVKPMVYAKSSGLQGDFTLSMFRFEVISKVTGEVSIGTIATDYLEGIPADTTTTVNTDLDNDGILNNLDTDMDGDGIANNIDPDPRDPLVNNVAPTNVVASVDKEVVKEDESFVLTGAATDANNDDVLTFTWTHDKDTAWKMTGESVTVDGLSPDTYIFTLTVSDGTLSAKDTVSVTVEKKGTGSLPITLIIAGVIFAIIIVVIIIIFARRGTTEEEKGDDSSEPMETAPTSEKTGTDEEDVIVGPPASDEAPPMPPRGETIAKEGLAATTVTDVEMLADPCPECGNPLGANEMKCHSCGAEFDLDLYCPNCESKIDESDSVCKNCGIKFDLEERPN